MLKHTNPSDTKESVTDIHDMPIILCRCENHAEHKVEAKKLGLIDRLSRKFFEYLRNKCL